MSIQTMLVTSGSTLKIRNSSVENWGALQRGFLFELLCYRDLCVYASVIAVTVYHYQDDSA